MVEIASIRKRIYDTVMLGRGTNASVNAAALEGTEDLPVAAKVALHDVDKVGVLRTVLMCVMA